MSPRALARTQLLGAAFLFSTGGAAARKGWTWRGTLVGVALLGGAIILGATTYKSWSESRVTAPVT
jgi:hypothetical protein